MLELLQSEKVNDPSHITPGQLSVLQVVRAPVALAMVKLLKLLPEEAMLQQLPPALQGVAHLLRNRLQRIRWVPLTSLLAYHPNCFLRYILSRSLLIWGFITFR